jgi:hypothetical protein
MKRFISIFIIIIICIILLFYIIYESIKNFRSGKLIPLISNKYLNQISDRISDNKLNRCLNPTIFLYKSQIYYVYRIYRGGNMLYPYLNPLRITYNPPSQNIIYNPETDKSFLINTDNSKIKKINGFEDPRAIVYKNLLYLIVNSENETTKKRQMFLIIINLKKLNRTVIPENILSLNYPENKNQKNWMPFLYKDELYLVFSLMPTKVLHCNTINVECTEVYNKLYNNNFSNLRGSSNIIKYNSTNYGTVFLGIVHSRYQYVYTHRFFISKYSTNFECLAISGEFIILENNLLFVDSSTISCFKKTGYIQAGIQFVAGLLQINNLLYITYGEHDYYAKRFKINT